MTLMNNKKSEQILPCKNLIACGYCNIKNCKYIHDYRIKSDYKNLKNDEYKQYDIDRCTAKGNKSCFYFPSLDSPTKNKYYINNRKFYREKELWDNFVNFLENYPKNPNEFNIIKSDDLNKRSNRLEIFMELGRERKDTNILENNNKSRNRLEIFKKISS